MIRLALVGWWLNARRAARLRGGKITAVVDADAGTAERASRALGATIWADSLDRLLSDHGGEFDAVVGPGQDQSSQAAAAARKHILASMPSSTGLAADLVAACAGAGVRLMAAHRCRFLPGVRTVKESLDAGKLGQPGLLRIHTWGCPTGSDSGPEALAIHAVNEIDLACWFFRQRPSDICAAGRDGYVQLHLGFPGGGMALLDYARTLPRGDGYSSLSLIGSTGAAYADEHHNMQLLFAGGQAKAVPTRQEDGYLLPMLQEFVTAIVEDREPSVSGADSLTALQVAEAAAASLATRAVRWDGQRYG